MNQQNRDTLQRWLDKDLDDQERAAFEQRLADDQDLQAELQLHERVGASLQRSFAVPDTVVPDTAVPDSAVPDSAATDTAVPDSAIAHAAPQQTNPAPPRWPQFLAGAISAAAVLLIWLQPWSNGQADEVMRTAVGRSWIAVCGQPDAPPSQSGCASSGQVSAYVKPLTPELPSTLVWHDRNGVRFQRGVEPEPLNGLRVLELLVLPQTQVYLFVVPASADPRPALPSNSDWNLFRKACGALVLYELTPLQQPHGLQCLSTGD